LIEAERQRALNKLTNGHQSTLSNLPAVTPILQVHYPTRAKERLERLRESGGRRGSAETDSTTRPNRVSRDHDIRTNGNCESAVLNDSRDQSQQWHDRSPAAVTVVDDSARPVLTHEQDATIRPSSSHLGQHTLMSPSIIRLQGAERPRYDQGHLPEDRADTRGDCTVQ
jgi:hypothetical protein